MNKKKKKSKIRQGIRFGIPCVLLVLLLAVALRVGIGKMKKQEESGKKQVSVQTAEKTGKDSQEKETAEVKKEEKHVETLDEKVQKKLDMMSFEEKVNQLFMVTPEQLTNVATAVRAEEGTRKAYEAHPVGGIIYFAKNLENPKQVKTMLSNTQKYAKNRTGLPVFLSVDEEGGQVARIAGNPAFGVPKSAYLSEIGKRGSTEEAGELGTTIGKYLKELGFNMDAAPDVDVLTNSHNEVVKYRSFSSDKDVVVKMAAAELKGLEEQGIIGMYKHFPGHGGTTADSHAGYAYVDSTLEELEKDALVPFQQGIGAGLRVIMVSHISCPEITGEHTPATLSKMMVTDVLREKMGFDGVVITDALNMGAITEEYSSSQAAVAALNAGVDILLMPADFESAYQGVMQAVKDGKLSEERIDESVRRILRIKLTM